MLVTAEIQSLLFWFTIGAFILMLVLLAVLAIIATGLNT
jgi:hypothetical protein